MTVAVTPIPFVKPQFFDQNGNPLSGGLIYTYDSGTNTPKATYTDYTGNVLNPNPVQLDAGGFAEIWLAAGDYKIAAEDSSHVPQWTVDGVPGFATLDFLQDPGSNGIVVRTSAGVTLARSIIGTAGHITVANGNGVSANPQIDVDTLVALIDAENAWAAKQTFDPNATKSGVNVGAAAAEPSAPVNGDLFYDSNTNELKARVNGAWIVLGAPVTPTNPDQLAKGWVLTEGAGTPTITTDYNVSSIADGGAGSFGINWDNPVVNGILIGSCIDNTATTWRGFEVFGGVGSTFMTMTSGGSLADPTVGFTLVTFNTP